MAVLVGCGKKITYLKCRVYDPLSESINENSTVQYILEQSPNASSEISQEPAVVTFTWPLPRKPTPWFSSTPNNSVRL